MTKGNSQHSPKKELVLALELLDYDTLNALLNELQQPKLPLADDNKEQLIRALELLDCDTLNALLHELQQPKLPLAEGHPSSSPSGSGSQQPGAGWKLFRSIRFPNPLCKLAGLQPPSGLQHYQDRGPTTPAYAPRVRPWYPAPPQGSQASSNSAIPAVAPGLQPLPLQGKDYFAEGHPSSSPSGSGSQPPLFLLTLPLNPTSLQPQIDVSTPPANTSNSPNSFSCLRSPEICGSGNPTDHLMRQVGLGYSQELGLWYKSRCFENSKNSPNQGHNPNKWPGEVVSQPSCTPSSSPAASTSAYALEKQGIEALEEMAYAYYLGCSRLVSDRAGRQA